MCELLGMSFNVPVRPNISFRGFRRRGEDNKDGWGLVYYPDEAAQIIKEPLKAGKSHLSEFLQNYKGIKSRVLIAHVRRVSKGEKTYKNTHPYQRELDGKDYVFAHNGTLYNYPELPLGRFKPIGETDSEYAFCHLLHSIDEKRITHWTEENLNWLAGKLEAINEYGRFNCLFSDGEYIFCYHDKEGYNGLCFVERKPPYGTIHLSDQDWEIDLAREKKPGKGEPEQRGFIIATHRLTDEEWKHFQHGELLVFKNGEMIYSSCCDLPDASERPLSSQELDVLALIRRSPNRVSLEEIIAKLSYPQEAITSAVQVLLCRRYIRQDRRDRVAWNQPAATFYTESDRRGEIDALLRHHLG